jgi:hypothetical protein
MYIGKINNLKEKKMEANCNGNKIIKTQTKHVYKKKKVKHSMFFFKWQMIRQVSRDYWQDNLKNAMVTC